MKQYIKQRVFQLINGPVAYLDSALLTYCMKEFVKESFDFLLVALTVLNRNLFRPGPTLP
jgi:hypothetical protein